MEPDLNGHITNIVQSVLTFGLALPSLYKMRLILLFAVLLFAVHASGQDAEDSIFQRVTRIVHHTIDSGDVVYRDTTHYKYSGERYQKFSIFNFYPGSRYGYCNSGYFSMLLASPVADLPDPLWDIYSFPVTVDSIFRHARTNNSHGGAVILVNDTVSAEFVDNSIVAGNTQGYHRYLFDYDESKRLSNIEMQHSHDRIYWGKVRWRKIVYGPNGKPSSDTCSSIHSPAINMASAYEYDGLDRINSYTLYAWRDTQWTPIRIINYSYNAAGQLETSVTLQSYVNWDTTEHKQMKYDDRGRLISYIDFGTAFTLHYNEKNEVDTYTIGNCYKVVFYYNRFHNPDSARTIVLQPCRTIHSGDHQTVYTYEEVKRKPPVDLIKGIIVYPNPANDHINIEWNSKLPTGPVSVTLYNTLRQEVLKGFIALPAPVERFDISHLASGVYILVITDVNSKKIHAAKVVVF